MSALATAKENTTQSTTENEKTRAIISYEERKSMQKTLHQLEKRIDQAERQVTKLQSKIEELNSKLLTLSAGPELQNVIQELGEAQKVFDESENEWLECLEKRERITNTLKV